MHTMATPILPSQTKTAWTHEQLVQQLEEDIAFGYLSPRERLVEDDLCQRFNTTRHAIRQALATLEQMGLIEKKKNIGALVRAYTAIEVLELYQVREILEVNAIKEIIFPVADEKIQALIEIQNSHDIAVDTDNLREIFTSNLAFHRYLFSLCENKTLVQAIDDYALRTHAIRSQTILNPTIVQQARQQHWALIEALKNQDRAALLDYCAQHLRPSRDFYVNSLYKSKG